MTVTENAATEQTPLQLAVEDCKLRIFEHVDEAIHRAVSIARFDLQNGIKHGPVALFGVVGGPVIEAAIGKLYGAIQDLARAEGGA